MRFKRELLTDSWTTQVDKLETALTKADFGAGKDCLIIAREVVEDGQLHVVIVKNKESALRVSDWSPPVTQEDGSFHYTCTFRLASTDHIVESITAMARQV